MSGNNNPEVLYAPLEVGDDSASSDAPNNRRSTPERRRSFWAIALPSQAVLPSLLIYLFVMFLYDGDGGGDQDQEPPSGEEILAYIQKNKPTSGSDYPQTNSSVFFRPNTAANGTFPARLLLQHKEWTLSKANERITHYINDHGTCYWKRNVQSQFIYRHVDDPSRTLKISASAQWRNDTSFSMNCNWHRETSACTNMTLLLGNYDGALIRNPPSSRVAAYADWTQPSPMDEHTMFSWSFWSEAKPYLDYEVSAKLLQDSLVLVDEETWENSMPTTTILHKNFQTTMRDMISDMSIVDGFEYPEVEERILTQAGISFYMFAALGKAWLEEYNRYRDSSSSPERVNAALKALNQTSTKDQCGIFPRIMRWLDSTRPNHRDLDMSIWALEGCQKSKLREIFWRCNWY